MIHWMLVLFVGTGDAVPALKTDLVFVDRAACFAYEWKLAQSNTEEENAATKSMRDQGKSQEEVLNSMRWMSTQYPRGTCIPTTLPPSVK